MRSPPRDLGDTEVASGLIAWGVHPKAIEYAPVGGGSHHWTATDDDGQHWFVTVDDLDAKPWLGHDRSTAFRGLEVAYEASWHLRASSGLGFVVSPRRTPDGDVLRRLTTRYTLALFPHVGTAEGHWGAPIDEDGRRCIIDHLVELHQADRPPGLRRRPLLISDRRWLEAGLVGALPRHAGPFSEAAQRLITSHSIRIRQWLDLFDLYARGVPETDLVVTHGEPHPGNFVATGSGYVAVDWDTVAWTRPERDLWMLDDGTGDAREVYERETEYTLDARALACYRNAWALTDLAAFARDLAQVHDDDPDSAAAISAIEAILDEREPAPYGHRHARPA